MTKIHDFDKKEIEKSFNQEFTVCNFMLKCSIKLAKLSKSQNLVKLVIVQLKVLVAVKYAVVQQNLYLKR